MKKEKAVELLKGFPELSEEIEAEMHRLFAPYIICDKNGNGYCTHCGQHIHFDDSPKHRQKAECPECMEYGMVIKNYYHDSGESAEERANAVAFMSNPEDDNLYIRCFELTLCFVENSLLPKTEKTEYQRYVFTPDGKNIRYGRNHYWEMRTVKRGGYYYEKHLYDEWVPREKYTAPVFPNKKCYDFVNVQAVKDTCMRYSSVDIYSGRDTFGYLKFYRSHKGAERLLKSGLSDIVRRKVDLCYDDKIDWNAKEVHKMLGVSADVCRAIRYGSIKLEDYRRVHEHFPDVPLAKLIAYNRIIGYQYGTLDWCVTSAAARVEEILKYLGSQNVTVSDYHDYLNSAGRLGYDTTDRSIAFPRDLRAAHDRNESALSAIKEEKERKRLEALDAKFKELTKKRKKMEFYFADYIIRQPLSAQEIVNEGKILSHCVGGYAERHSKGGLSIMFLRKKDEPDKPYYTIEVSKEGKIIQCRGYANNWVQRGGEEKPQEIKDFEILYQEHLDRVFSKSKKKARITA